MLPLGLGVGGEEVGSHFPGGAGDYQERRPRGTPVVSSDWEPGETPLLEGGCLTEFVHVECGRALEETCPSQGRSNTHLTRNHYHRHHHHRTSVHWVTRFQICFPGNSNIILPQIISQNKILCCGSHGRKCTACFVCVQAHVCWWRGGEVGCRRVVKSHTNLHLHLHSNSRSHSHSHSHSHVHSVLHVHLHLPVHLSLSSHSRVHVHIHKQRFIHMYNNVCNTIYNTRITLGNRNKSHTCLSSRCEQQRKHPTSGLVRVGFLVNDGRQNPSYLSAEGARHMLKLDREICCMRTRTRGLCQIRARLFHAVVTPISRGVVPEDTLTSLKNIKASTFSDTQTERRLQPRHGHVVAIAAKREADQVAGLLSL